MGYLNLGSCKWTGDAHTDALIEATINNYTIEWKKADAVIKREKYNITNGDELPQTGVIQMAKVYIAKKRKLKVGDKMAGATVTRVSSPVSCATRICRSSRTVRSSTSA